MIRFSIITCTFNAEAVIERTLDSVLEQTHSHLEHLIIDGASKDRTVEMAQHYKTKSDEEDHCHDVIICSEPDGGLYDAMNKAIAKATGDYVLFLNAGDVFPSPDTLEMVAESVGDGEALPAVLYGDTDIVNEEGRFLRHRRLAAPRRLTWRSFMKGMLVCHQAKILLYIDNINSCDKVSLEILSSLIGLKNTNLMVLITAVDIMNPDLSAFVSTMVRAALITQMKVEPLTIEDFL